MYYKYKQFDVSKDIRESVHTSAVCTVYAYRAGRGREGEGGGGD